MTTDITNEHPNVVVEADDAEFEFDDEAGPDDEIDLEADIDEGVDVDLDDETDPVDSVDAEIDIDGAVLAIVDPAAPPAAQAGPAPTAESDVDDDVLIVDEVEASLDIILAERMRAGDADTDEVDDEDEEEEAPSQLATVIPVRRPEEFLCQSCFLLKPPGQLADIDHQLCRDCA